MLRKNNGYSILEFLAVTLIISIIIFPLISSLSKNLEFNQSIHRKKSAIGTTDVVMNSVRVFDYADLRNKVDISILNGDYYYEINIDKCTDLSDSDDALVCQELLGTVWNNISFDKDELKVIFFEYGGNATNILNISNNTNLPQNIRSYFSDLYNDNNIPSTNNLDLIKVLVFIDYGESSHEYILIEGLMYNG